MQILNWDGQNAVSPTIAVFDIYFPQLGMTLRRFKIRKSKKGSLFISSPVFMASTDEFGNKKFEPYVDFSKEKYNDFQKAVLELCKGYMEVPYDTHTQTPHGNFC